LFSISFGNLSFFQFISIGLFGFVFGVFEMTTNLFYLINRNYDLSRKQHSKELPLNATNAQVVHKVIQMLILGVILLIVSFISSITLPQFFVIGAAFILMSGLIDYAKYRKKYIAIIWTLISIIACTFSLIPPA